MKHCFYEVKNNFRFSFNQRVIHLICVNFLCNLAFEERYLYDNLEDQDMTSFTGTAGSSQSGPYASLNKGHYIQAEMLYLFSVTVGAPIPN